MNLVKAKTPKITFYSDQAKCLLMENSPEDFEVLFYSGKYQGITFIIYFKQYFNCKFCSPGSKVSKNGNVVKAIDDCGRSVSYQMSDISNLIASNINLQHFLFVSIKSYYYHNFVYCDDNFLNKKNMNLL